MISIVLQCIDYDKHSFAMHWDCIAYDELSNAIHIAYDKHSCAMHWAKHWHYNAYDKHSFAMHRL